MITGNDKNSGNIFYQQIIDYLYTDKFVEDLKNVLQNKNFQSQKNKIKDYFRAPIKHISYLKKMRYSPQQKPNDVKKEYFYFKEDRELLRKIFVIQSTFKYSPDYCYLPIKSEQFDWNSFFSNFERENQSLKGDELSIQIGKYLQNNIPLKPNNRSKSFSEYINYIYSSNSGQHNIFRFLNNLYFDDETTALKYIVKEEFKNYRGKDFRLTNLTALNSNRTKINPTATMRIFTKLIPQYYSYLSGLVTEKQFLTVLVTEMREYILETLKVRMMENWRNSLPSQNSPESFLKYLSFEYNNGSILKCSINEFSIQEQKYLLKLMRDTSNKQLFDENLELCIYLEEKFKGD